MSEYLPPGRLSKVSEDGVLLQIQTEFSWRPRPRVATTVSLDGVVLHKIQKDWDAPLETDEQKKVVENFVNKQHDEVVEVIKAKKKELVKGHKGKGISSALADLTELKGVYAAWCLTRKGVVTSDSGGKELLPEYISLFENLVSLCEFLAETTAVGDFVEGRIVLEEDNLIVMRKDKQIFVIGFDNVDRAQELVTEIRNVIEAA